MTGEFVFVKDFETWTPPSGRVIEVPPQIRKKRELFGFFRRALELPVDCLRNWDALDECLHDLSWLGESPHIILVHRELPFGENSTKSRMVYLEMLQGLVQDNMEVSVRWTIALQESMKW